MRGVAVAGLVVLLALGLAATGFAVGPESSEQFSPVPFDQTLSTGLTGVDVQQAEQQGWVVPKAEVFYSQYQYVVGYYGLESLATALDSAQHRRQFGDPMAVFVTDLTGTGPRLTDQGYVTLSESVAQSWVRLDEAVFVVGTDARTPAGSTAVPFGDRTAAEGFAEQYDGRVLDWDGLQSRLVNRSDGERDPLGAVWTERQRWADRAVAQAGATDERPVSVVVGEDAPTLAAAVDRAPPNTTVRLPPGTYRVNLTVDKPLTLRGAGNETVLDGGGTGTLLTVQSPRVTVADLHMSGVGSVGASQSGTTGDEGWDEQIRLIYGRGDAAIRLAQADHSLVENVSIETPANGVVALNSTGAVVRNASIEGSDTWEEGFMSVLTMYSRMVVEDTTFDGGRDGVYTHYADGTVVRDNEMRNLRYGLHTMYTSDVLAANNTARNTDAGIILMTRPTGNALVGNDVRESELGIATVGSASFVAENTLAGNKIGLSIGTSRSLYRENTVVRNQVGVRLSTLLPTNDVFANDVVGNDQTVSTGVGPLSVWASDGRGNYWGRVPGMDRDGDGVVDRGYRPANPLDASVEDSIGGYTLAHSPTAGAIRQFQQSVPGLRNSGVVDPAPLTDPARPAVLDRLNVTHP